MMKKRQLTAILCALLILSVLPAEAMAAPVVIPDDTALLSTGATGTFEGILIAAVNTETEGTSEGTFSTSQSVRQSLSRIPGGRRETSVRDVYVDAAGNTVTVREADFEDPVPVMQEGLVPPKRLNKIGPGGYSVGAIKHLEGSYGESNDMKCLYVGEHCTVWGCEADGDVFLPSETAEEIAARFDSFYDEVIASFGAWYDADGDGKLAIMCYDIEQEYLYGSSGSYLAGFFRSMDLIDGDGYVGNIQFAGIPSSMVLDVDCIHIDTYPGMSDGADGDPFTDVSRCYSTLVHEFQHMINFSYQVKGDSAGDYYDAMNTSLNEAFSMAAEHIICGADYYNGEDYETGSALLNWEGTLSSYSNNYLFGQYLRTRYARYTSAADNGNSFYRTVLEARDAYYAANPAERYGAGFHDVTLDLIADMLGTTPKQLLLDFWSAVLLNKPDGDMGFGGEAWADALVPHIGAAPATGENIYTGGAVFYSISAPFTVSESQHLTFMAFGIPEGISCSLEGNTLTVNVVSGDDAHLFMAVYSSDGRLRQLEAEDIDAIPYVKQEFVYTVGQNPAECSIRLMLLADDWTPVYTAVEP